jgi:hypothetical protein
VEAVTAISVCWCGCLLSGEVVSQVAVGLGMRSQAVGRAATQISATVLAVIAVLKIVGAVVE